MYFAAQDIEARFEPRAEKGQQTETAAAGSAGTGNRRAVAAEIALDNACEAAQAAIQFAHGLRVGTFLRCKLESRAAASVQRIVDVTRGDDANAQFCLRCEDAVELQQPGAGRRDLVAAAVEKCPAQRRCQADAAVVGRAAAEADDHLLRAGRDRAAQLDAAAERRRAPRIAQRRRQRRQPAGGGEIEQRRVAVAEPSPLGSARTPRGVDTRAAPHRAAGRADQRGGKAFAAVRQGLRGELRIRPRTPQPAHNRTRGLIGGQCALELVGHHQHARGRRLIAQDRSRVRVRARRRPLRGRQAAQARRDRRGRCRTRQSRNSR